MQEPPLIKSRGSLQTCESIVLSLLAGHHRLLGETPDVLVLQIGEASADALARRMVKGNQNIQHIEARRHGHVDEQRICRAAVSGDVLIGGRVDLDGLNTILRNYSCEQEDVLSAVLCHGITDAITDDQFILLQELLSAKDVCFLLLFLEPFVVAEQGILELEHDCFLHSSIL